MSMSIWTTRRCPRASHPTRYERLLRVSQCSRCGRALRKGTIGRVCARKARERITAAVMSERRTKVPVAELTDLDLVPAPPARLGGGGSLRFTGETITVAPRDPILVRQRSVKSERVREYLERPFDEPVMVYRDDDGNLWHVDGLHRLVSARLRGESVRADVWAPR